MCEVLFDRVPTFYLERVVNEILPGLQMYARDTNLTSDQASLYVPGSIICELGFTDATSRFMGMATTHRITILSNHMVNFSQMSDDPVVQSWELCVAQHGSHFKVLDVHTCGDKTQILLLHLPDDENWRIFEQIKLNLEDNLVEMARERFDAKCSAEVIPELATERWLERTSWVLGFLEDGSPQPLCVPIEERMKPLGEIGFRRVVGSVVLLSELVTGLVEQGADAPFAEDYPDLLGYGYIDSQVGLCVHALTSARVVDGAIEWAHDFDDVMLKVRLSGFEQVPVAQVVDGSLSQFAERITMVEEGYAPNHELAELRDMRFMDNLRYLTSPDDILVTLLTKTKTLYDEEVWVRLRGMREDIIYGELLNEPHQDLDVHAGMAVPIAFAETEQGIRAFVLIDELEKRLRQGQHDDSMSDDARLQRAYAYCVLPKTPVPVEEYLDNNDEEIARRFELLIRTEAPIERTWLCNRIRASFGIGRSGRLVQQRSDEILARVPHSETYWNGATFVWRNDQTPSEHRYYRVPGDGEGRESNQIPYEELVLAMRDVMSSGESISEDELIRRTAHAFGFTRIAARIRSVFSLAIMDAVKDGQLARGSDGMLSGIECDCD